MDKQIVLFTDGSEASDRATKLAVELAEFYKTKINAFFIIDSGWGSLLGDEWINTSETRMRFYKWFEGELETFAAEALKKVIAKAQEKGVQTQTQILIGPTEKLIIKNSQENHTSCVVLPNPRATSPGAAGGLRFNISSLVKKISCPILIGPAS